MDEQESPNRSLVLVQPKDDVSESAPKMKNEKCGGAVADVVDLDEAVTIVHRISFPIGVILILR